MDKFILEGTESDQKLPAETAGNAMFNSLLKHSCNEDALIDVFTNTTLSYKKLLEESCRLAEALRKRNYPVGTVLCICSANSIEFFIPVLASLFAGTLICPLNPLYMPYELIHLLRISKPKIVFCSQAVSKTFILLKEALEWIEQVVIIDTEIETPGVQTLSKFINQSLRNNVVDVQNFEPFNEDPTEHPAFLLPSSGSTGLPKLVKISQYAIRIALEVLNDPRYPFLCKHKSASFGVMPYFHTFGLNVGLHALFNHYKCIVFRRFDEGVYLEAIQKYNIETLLLVPPIAVFLAKSPKVDDYNLSSVKCIFSGGSPLSHAVGAELKKRLKLNLFGQFYGMTEVTITSHILDRSMEKPNSCGRLIPHMLGKIRSAHEGRSLGPEEVGEICLKGPLLMMGYYNNELATECAFTADGWLRTGDLGYYDSDGYFFITGRLKELIKYNSYQVPPAEIEAILMSHPKVLDAGVVGRPDESSGELPTAFVVKKDDVEVTEEELQAYVASLVSPQKKLRGGVIFISSIPRNSTGKIMRYKLKEGLSNYA